MVNDDQVPSTGGVEDSDAPTGARRTTFTPASAAAYEQFVETSGQEVPVNAPPPSPASAMTPPRGSALPEPPRRVSLADDELVSTLAAEAAQEGRSLDAIERLQEQLLLREREAREFRNWESSMVAIGTPEALDVVEETRPAFTEALQIITSSRPALTAGPGPLPELAAPVPALAMPETVRMDAGSLDARFEADVTGDDDTLEPPVEPVPSPRTSPNEALIVADVEVARLEALILEGSGAEPTLLEHRIGRATRMFWLWFAANSSVISIVFGGMLLSLGMSLRQAIVAALAGAALSFLPLGLSTLASKWNGQPTMVVSRASFGLIGNVLPALLSLVTRLFWGAVLLWFLSIVTARILFSTGLGGSFTEFQLAIVAAGGAFLIALVAAFFGYTFLARVQLVLSILSGALIVALIAVSWPLIDMSAALTVADGPWTLVLAGAILVFSLLGLIWSTSGGDLARYQRPSSPGSGSMVFASFGSVLPAFVLIVYGAVLSASNNRMAVGFVVNPVETLVAIVPPWFLLPLVAAVAVGLLSSVMLSIYSGGFALQALGVRLHREAAIVVVGLAVAAAAVGMLLLAVDLTILFRDFATTLAVPTAAWAGIFCAEVMIRNRRFDAHSLLQAGGVYPPVNWVNLVMLVVAAAIGYGLTTASVGWLSWQGYLFGVVGIPGGSDLARADIGVLIALAVGLLTPVVAGVRTIRRQEQVRD